MAGNQSKNHRIPAGLLPNVASSQGPSQAPVGRSTSYVGTSRNASGGTLSRVRRFFYRSKECFQSSTISDSRELEVNAGQVQGEYLPEIQGSGDNAQPGRIPATIGGDIGAAFDGRELTSHIDGGTVDLTAFKDFNEVITTLPEIHPYFHMALGILTAASHSLLNQSNLDKEMPLLRVVKNVYEFLTKEDNIKNIQSMKETAGKIARVTSGATQFIINYPQTRNFWEKSNKQITHETETITGAYAKMLDVLMKQSRCPAPRDVPIDIYPVLEDLDLDWMACAQGAGLVSTKRCLDGTREEVLTDIVNWIHDADGSAPHILWLYGEGGKGKSAIAQTIALWFKSVGGTGACFCFSLDRQAEHREEKLFATVARDLANCDPAFRRALAAVIAKDRSLMSTSDFTLQWEKFILEPLAKASVAMVGKVVVVIDALDESGLVPSRVLSVLASTRTANLPRNLRVLVTSRPLPGREFIMGPARIPHVKSISLDDVPPRSMERDIWRYAMKQIGHLQDIGAPEVYMIAQKSAGFFEWARLACEFIQSTKPGCTVKERFDKIVRDSGDGRTLLDVMYRAILDDVFQSGQITFAKYHSVMQQVLLTLEPLLMVGLNKMRSCFPREEDRYDVAAVLAPMAFLLGGITDRSSPIQPFHASFYDFLKDCDRSHEYFIDIDASDEHYHLAFASLQILRNDLHFNICALESSYTSNSEDHNLSEKVHKNISSHLSYSCRFWAQHLQKVASDPALARFVEAILGSEKFLFWLEALSLLGAFGNAATALASAAEWLQGQAGSEGTATLAREGVNFVHTFAVPILHSAPHLYISALPLAPSNSVLFARFRSKFSHLARVVEGGLNDWPVAQLTLLGHSSLVSSVSFSCDGKRIASGSDDKTIRIWDAVRGVQIGSPLQGHKSVHSVAFSHDGRWIVTGGDDNIVSIWDIESGAVIICFEGHHSRVRSVAFSSDAKRIVSGSDDCTVKIWGVESCRQIGDLRGHALRVRSVAFSHDDKTIISGSVDTTVRVWHVESGMWVHSKLCGHRQPVFSVAFSYDDKRIVSGSEDKTIKIWDAMEKVQIGTINGHDALVYSVSFSPDGRRIVSSSSDKTVRLWDVESRLQIGSSLQGHTTIVRSVAFSPDGMRVVSGSQDKTVRVWDGERGEVCSSSQDASQFFSIAFSCDGSKIVSGSEDKTVRVWDVESGKQIGSPLVGHSSQVCSVACSHHGNMIVSGSHDNTLRVWHAEGGVWVDSIFHGHEGPVFSVTFSQDDKRIVSGSEDMTVRIWDAKGGVHIGSYFQGHTSSVFSVAFSPDCKRVVSGSNDKTIRVWNVERGVQIGAPLQGHKSSVHSVAFSHDGTRIVSGSYDKTVRVWDAEIGVQLGVPLEGHSSWVHSVAFSPDGKWIVSGSDDKTVRVWDTEESVEIGSPLQGHASWVNSVAVSPDGKTIASGSNDKTVRLWNAQHYMDMIRTTNRSKPVYPIVLSSSQSHALHDSKQILDDLPRMVSQPVTLGEDGWIRGPAGRLLLWIPPMLQGPFYSMWTTKVIPAGCIVLDLSKMVHGKMWQECFKSAA